MLPQYKFIVMERLCEEVVAAAADGTLPLEPCAHVIWDALHLLYLPELRVGVTCIRVPVLRAHSMAITAEFDSKVSVDAARSLLAKAPGVKVVDDREKNHFPMPIESGGQNDVLVGRIREDISDPTGHSLALFISGDQLLKGAALNAVQIAERLA
jgi:aspartate-semialdehyde dehydrogenase